MEFCGYQKLKEWKDPLLRALEAAWAYQHIDFGLGISRAMRGYNSVVLSPQFVVPYNNSPMTVTWYVWKVSYVIIHWSQKCLIIFEMNNLWVRRWYWWATLIVRVIPWIGYEVFLLQHNNCKDLEKNRQTTPLTEPHLLWNELFKLYYILHKTISHVWLG